MLERTRNQRREQSSMITSNPSSQSSFSSNQQIQSFQNQPQPSHLLDQQFEQKMQMEASNLISRKRKENPVQDENEKKKTMFSKETLNVSSPLVKSNSRTNTITTTNTKTISKVQQQLPQIAQQNPIQQKFVQFVDQRTKQIISTPLENDLDLFSFDTTATKQKFLEQIKKPDIDNDMATTKEHIEVAQQTATETINRVQKILEKREREGTNSTRIRLDKLVKFIHDLRPEYYGEE